MRPPALTRRRFAASGVLALAGCGGSGGSDVPASATPAPAPAPAASPPPPPLPAIAPGLHLLAGAPGGSGRLAAAGEAGRVDTLYNLALAPDGALWFSLASGFRVGVVTPQGSVRFVPATVPLGNEGMACDPRGVLHICAGSGGRVLRLVEDDTGSRFDVVAGRPPPPQLFQLPQAVDGPAATAVLSPVSPLFDAEGNLWFAEKATGALRRLSPAGVVTTVAAGAPRPSGVTFELPPALVRLPGGDFVILHRNRLRRITPAGAATLLPATLPHLEPESLAAEGNDTLLAAHDNLVVRVALAGGMAIVTGALGDARFASGTASEARFDFPTDVLPTPAGLAIVDRNNWMVRRIDAGGQLVSVIGVPSRAGRLDGAGTAARLRDIGPMTADAFGNVYWLDPGSRAVRRVTPQGVVTTVLQDFPADGGLAVDREGNCYGVQERAIVRVTPAGVRSIHAGEPTAMGFDDGPALSARFARPLGLAFDARGNLFVGDAPQPGASLAPENLFNLAYGNTIRRITPQGQVSTVAGTPGRILERVPFENRTAVGQPSLDFFRPSVLACDAAGNVLVLDTALGAVHRIPAGGGPATLLAADGRSSVLGASGVKSVSGLAVTPDGTVYLARQRQLPEPGAMIERLGAGGTETVVAGVDAPFRYGLSLGPLPGALNAVAGLVGLADGTLVAACENSMVRIQLAGGAA